MLLNSKLTFLMQIIYRSYLTFNFFFTRFLRTCTKFTIYLVHQHNIHLYGPIWMHKNSPWKKQYTYVEPKWNFVTSTWASFIKSYTIANSGPSLKIDAGRYWVQQWVLPQLIDELFLTIEIFRPFIKLLEPRSSNAC